MPFRFGPIEIILILTIIVIIFGVGRLPQVSEFIGRGLRSLRGRKDDSGSEDREAVRDEVKVIRKLEDDKTLGEPVAKTDEAKEAPRAG